MPDDDRIERAAAAIYEKVCNRSGKGCGWDRLLEKQREYFREEAKAALEAADGPF
jgi:hypothetical protein